MSDLLPVATASIKTRQAAAIYRPLIRANIRPILLSLSPLSVMNALQSVNRLAIAIERRRFSMRSTLLHPSPMLFVALTVL